MRLNAKIWDRIYLGSFKDAQQLATANPWGIITVVSLCEEPVRRAANITYVYLPIADSHPIVALRFEQIMKAIVDRVRRGNLMLHCVGGSSRSPIMVAAWLHRCGYAENAPPCRKCSECVSGRGPMEQEWQWKPGMK